MITRIQQHLVAPWLLIFVAGCGLMPAASTRPQFSGEQTEWWLAQESASGGRDDLLPAFEASARSYGCSTEQIGSESSLNIHGERRSYYGVSASCDEGGIALISLAGGRVRIGCTMPTTPRACDLLLHNISQAR